MADFDKYRFLFLDRDGVINRERPGDYVKDTTEFVFEEGALEAISILSRKFKYIFVITNQRGVGRGTMSIADLHKVHEYMLTEIHKAGGNITKIYFCTDLQSFSINRKPNTGMAYKVKEEYPDVDFNESIMVGNSKSDIEFGKKLGMYSVLVGNKYPEKNKIYKMVDAYCENLYKFATILI